MRISTRRMLNDVAIVNVRGDISFSKGSREFGEKIKELLETGVRNILLNAQQIGHIDSSGIGQLLQSYTSVGNRGGEFKLLNPTKTLYEVLVVTKLVSIFDIYDDEEKAIGSFLEQEGS